MRLRHHRRLGGGGNEALIQRQGLGEGFAFAQRLGGVEQQKRLGLHAIGVDIGLGGGGVVAGAEARKGLLDEATELGLAIGGVAAGQGGVD
ncbi:hypothetical protein BVG81_001225 [Haliangium sp. UPWRP_2]|nr:hypothetical protein BVG81_001225 [Haliangium sp. UPWRP_2]